MGFDWCLCIVSGGERESRCNAWIWPMTRVSVCSKYIYIVVNGDVLRRLAFLFSRLMRVSSLLTFGVVTGCLICGGLGASVGTFRWAEIGL